MDDETRFWIAQQVSDTKNTADITPLFKSYPYDRITK